MSSGEAEFVIVGGGLGGALLAVHLGQAGHSVDVYEMRGDMRSAAVAAGRSINLAVSHRGLSALEQVGLAEEVLRNSVPMPGRMIHSLHGELKFQRYGTEAHQVIHSASRGALNVTLLNAAAGHPNVRLFFHQRCTSVHSESGEVEFTHTQSGERTTVRNRVVIGADGAFSAVRRHMQKLEGFNYRQEYLGHGYKELTIPAGPDGGHRLEKNALHIWPRRSFMMIALPNLDGSFTCTLFWPLEGANSFAALQTPDDVLRYFEKTFPDAAPLMPTLAEDYFRNPTSRLVTIRCDPWQVGDRIALLGDACHAVVPFYGQGMNAAFEDVIVLMERLRKHPSDRSRAFFEYFQSRKVNVDTLADLAVANFTEMRDHTGSRLFLWKKKGEHLLHKLFPRWYIPLYTLVTFTRMPYAEAARRARRQNRAMLCAVAIGLSALVVGVAALLW